MTCSPSKTALPIALLAAALAAPLVAQQDQEKPQAEEKLSRRQVLQRAVSLARLAKQDYDAGKYQAAAKRCEQVIALVARSPNTHYLHAACLLKLDKNDQALTALEQAVADGLTGAAKLKAEVFDPIRHQKRFKALAEKLAAADKRAEAGLEPAPVKLEGVKTVEGDPEGGFPWRIRMSPDATARKPQRLIVWLHPSGGSMNPAIERMSPHFIDDGWAVMVVAAKPWRYWTTKHIRKLVNKTLPDAAGTPGIDAREPVLLGYSAGGQAALQMWTAKPEAYGGLVLDAAYPSDMPHWRKTRQHRVQKVPGKDGTNDTPIFVRVGAADAGARLWRQAQKAWKDQVPLTVHYIPNQGHTWLLGPEQFRALKKWLAQIEPVEEGKAADATRGP
jgi:tetratricopeptide (TPR) repeat protein